jgi:uncharacterized membrane-anchored protein YitT (DUF2179 family)
MTMIKRKWARYALVIISAMLGALNYEIFVFPNNFAPAGLNGFLTIIRHLTGFGFGYLYLILNIPLLLVAFKVLKRHFAVYTFVYVIVFALTSLLLKDIDITRYAFVATDGGERIMAAIAAGVFNGAFYSATLRVGGSTGGMDIVAAFINHSKPEFSLVWIIFLINVIVALMSFFAYGMNYVPVILCIVYSFVTSRVSDTSLKGSKSAAKFEVVTSQPDELASELMAKLHHGCTVVPAKGMYSHTDKSLLICVVNNMQISDFERVISKYHDTFVVVSSVAGTYGNFKKIK